MATHLTGPLFINGVPCLPSGRPIMGTIFFVDYVNGNDANDGQAPTDEGLGHGPLKTLATALSKCTSGAGDVVYLNGGANGASYCPHRLSAALDWNKDNCHIVGLGGRAAIAQRCRIAEVSGTGIATLFTVSGNGCEFWDFHVFHGTSDNEDQTAVAVSGERNLFANVHIGGMGHATPAGRAGSKSLALSGHENTFKNCVIGLTTIDRTAANAEIVISGNAARNIFEGCTFLSRCTGSGTGHGFISLAANSLQDFVLFRNCTGINAKWASYGVAMAYAILKTVADVNGLVVLENCNFNATNLASDLTDVVAVGRFDGTDLTTDLGLFVTPTNT